MNRCMQFIERIWRHIMTPLCFLIFGVGGLLLSVIWFNCLFLFCSNKTKRTYIARQSISYSFRLFLRITKTVGVLNYSYHGLEKLQEDSGTLILSNHPTLLDYVLVAAVMPQVDCLVKSSLLRNPFVSGVIRACDYLINNQHEILLSECHKRLTQGDNILIFPEGTRTTPGVKPHLQRGAANIALRCQCPVRFLHIQNNEIALTKYTKWYHIPKRKLLLSLTVRESMHVDELVSASIEQTSIKARHLTRAFETKLI